MYKIAVVGDYDSIYGFASLGLTVFPIEDDMSTEEAAKKLHTIVGGEYGVIYITEHLADRLSKEIARYDGQIMPAIILIPGVKNNTGDGIRRVKKTVEQAVGSDILFGSE